MTLYIGYNTHQTLRGQRPYSAEEKAALWSHFDKIKPTALLFFDLNDAREAKQRYPACNVIHRHWYEDEGGIYKRFSAQQFYDQHAHEGDGGIIVNVLNEPNGYQSSDEHKRIAHWCSEVMDLFGAAGIPIVTPNWGVGHPNENNYADFNELFEAFKRWPMHFRGIHEYWSYKGIEAGNGRVGRFLWMDAYLREHGFPIPNTIFSEWGLDNLLDGSNKRGWRDSRTPQAYAAECLEAARRYYDFSYVKGVCLFSYGNSGKESTAEDWVSYDVSDAPEFQQFIEGAYMVVEPPARKYQTDKTYIYSGANSFNIRSTPSTAPTSSVKGKLQKGDKVRFADVDAVSANDHLWQQATVYPVIGGGLEISGWLAVDIIPLTVAPEKSAIEELNEILDTFAAAEATFKADIAKWKLKHYPQTLTQAA